MLYAAPRKRTRPSLTCGRVQSKGKRHLRFREQANRRKSWRLRNIKQGYGGELKQYALISELLGAGQCLLLSCFNAGLDRGPPVLPGPKNHPNTWRMPREYRDSPVNSALAVCGGTCLGGNRCSQLVRARIGRPPLSSESVPRAGRSPLATGCFRAGMGLKTCRVMPILLMGAKYFLAATTSIAEVLAVIRLKPTRQIKSDLDRGHATKEFRNSHIARE